MKAEVMTMDAIEYVSSFGDGFFDLIILDPDYQDWKSLIARGLLDECLRALKKDGNMLCFTKQPFDYDLRIACNKNFRREIVWTFENGGAWCSPKMPLISSQKIYWLTKSKEFYFNARTGMPYADSTKSFKRKTKVFGEYESEGRAFEKSDDGVWLRDHLHFNKPSSGKIPAKPEALMRVLVKCFCKPDGRVLDPFLGTGTAVRACEGTNRDIYGCEIDEDRTKTILNTLKNKKEI